MTKNIIKIVIVFLVGMVGGIFADQIFWPYFVERPLFYKYGLDNPAIYLTEQKQVTIQENSALTEAVEKVAQTIVGVKTQTKTGVILEGSGLIVTSDGLILTLAELLPQNSTPVFFVDGEQVPFQILKRDFKSNLALIRIEKSNLKTVGFANLESLKLGERVFLAGIIFDAKLNPAKVVNEGIVKFFDKDKIKTNITENYLLAGSSLFNIQGEVLGLNAIDAEDRVSAIPISKIKEFVGF